MIEKMTIEQLATLPFNNLVCGLDEDDPRWLQLITLKPDLCPVFDSWLKKNKLERIPKNALKYMSEQYDLQCMPYDRQKMLESTAQLEKADFRLGFRLLVSKRLKQYKDNPYQGNLDVGHYVGVKKEAGIDPLTIQDHFLGEIFRVHKDTQDKITSFDLYDEEGNLFTVPAELTYRIY